MKKAAYALGILLFTHTLTYPASIFRKWINQKSHAPHQQCDAVIVPEQLSNQVPVGEESSHNSSNITASLEQPFTDLSPGQTEDDWLRDYINKTDHRAAITKDVLLRYISISNLWHIIIDYLPKPRIVLGLKKPGSLDYALTNIIKPCTLCTADSIVLIVDNHLTMHPLFGRSLNRAKVSYNLSTTTNDRISYHLVSEVMKQYPDAHSPERVKEQIITIHDMGENILKALVHPSGNAVSFRTADAEMRVALAQVLDIIDIPKKSQQNSTGSESDQSVILSPYE